MPRDIFFQTGDPQKQLDKLNKAQLKAFTRVSAGVLNKQAFTARTGFIETLTKDNTIRTPALLKARMRVKKVKKSDSIRNQVAIAGSITGARHDGWSAIDQGKSVEATTFTHEGRVRGSESGKSKKAAREGQDTTTQMDDFRLSGVGGKRVVMYLQSIAKDKALRRKPFFLPGNYKRMKQGIYKFKGGRMGVFKSNGRKYKKTLVNPKIVRLSGPDSKYKAKKSKWNVRTIDREIDNSFMRKVWREQMNRELKAIKRRFK